MLQYVIHVSKGLTITVFFFIPLIHCNLKKKKKKNLSCHKLLLRFSVSLSVCVYTEGVIELKCIQYLRSSDCKVFGEMWVRNEIDLQWAVGGARG